MAEYLTFQNIYDTVCNAIGDNGLSGSQSRLSEVKAAINMAYQEVMMCDDLYPLFWMMDLIDSIKTKAKTSITGITAANPCVVSSSTHGYVTGDIIQITELTGGMTELNDRIFLAVRNSADDYILADLFGNAIDTSAYAAYSSGGIAQHRGITLAKKFNSIYSFAWKGYTGPVLPISAPESNELASWMDAATTSKPERYMLKPCYVPSWVESGLGSYLIPVDDFRQDRLLWFTLPDQVYSARIWGHLRAQNLDLATDVPRMPAEFHHSIIAGTIARMVKYGEIQIENAVIWPGIYKMHIAAIQSYNRKWWKQYNKDERSDTYLL